MAQKRSKKTKTRNSSRRQSNKKKSSGFSLGKFTLGLFILIGLGYAGLAIWEGRLVPSEFSEIELPDFINEQDHSDSQRPSIDNKTPEDKQESDDLPSRGESESNKVNRNDFDLYFTKAFDFGWPAYTTNEAIIERPYYTLRYNEIHEQADWVAYKLSADSLKQDGFKKEDDYRKDPRVRTGSAELIDYRGSGYVKGQLAPAADFSYDEFGMSQTFYMSNMSPQDQSFNSGIWNKLEVQVRKWAIEEKEIYVVTGPILTENLPSIGKNKVTVPLYYYKIILDIEQPEIKAIAFLMKNESSSQPLSSFVVSIDEIEYLTKLDFFPAMPDELENFLESGMTTKEWIF